MSSISVLPGLGTQTANIAVELLPSGDAAPARIPTSAAGAPVSVMTDASAQAFAVAVAAFVAVLTPHAVTPQRGALLFGLPI